MIESDSKVRSLLSQRFTSESQSLSNDFRVPSQSHSAPQNHQLRLDRRFHLLRSSAKSMTRHGRTLFWGNASWERLLSMSEGILVLSKYHPFPLILHTAQKLWLYTYLGPHGGGNLRNATRQPYTQRGLPILPGMPRSPNRAHFGLIRDSARCGD